MWKLYARNVSSCKKVDGKKNAAYIELYTDTHRYRQRDEDIYYIDTRLVMSVSRHVMRLSLLHTAKITYLRLANGSCLLFGSRTSVRVQSL